VPIFAKKLNVARENSAFSVVAVRYNRCLHVTIDFGAY
jgi:hypothetical protein